MKRRGLSPVIATVLLIAIALTLALAIFMWAKTWVGEKIEKDIGGGPQAIEMFCEDVSFEARVKGDGEVTITNIGNIPIYNVEVKKIRKGSVKDLGSLGTTGIAVGSSMTGKLVGASLTEGEDVNVIPILLGETESFKTPYVCDDKYGEEVVVS